MGIFDLNAYEVVLTEDLPDLKSKGYLLKHKKSGARVLLMENDDENKVFTIGFRTPPSDSTGVPHIMEHSVLCGSRDFPVKMIGFAMNGKSEYDTPSYDHLR